MGTDAMNRAERRVEARREGARLKRARGGDGLVQLGYLHSHTVSHSWAESFMRMVAYDAGHRARVVGTGGPIAIRCDSGSIPESRNLLAQMFLDQTPHEWLMMIDTDMGFLPSAVDELVDSADAVDMPIMGGLCFVAREIASDGYGGRRVVAIPTLFRLAHDASGAVGFANTFEYPKDSIVEVNGTGGAFLLIHRTVLEKVRAEFGDHWFSQMRLDGGGGRVISEDLSFCARAGKMGVKVHVNTAVKTTHHKSVWLGEDDYHLNGPGLAVAVSRETGVEVTEHVGSDHPEPEPAGASAPVGAADSGHA